VLKVSGKYRIISAISAKNRISGVDYSANYSGRGEREKYVIGNEKAMLANPQTANRAAVEAQ